MKRIKWLFHILPKTIIIDFIITFFFFFASDIGILLMPLFYAKILDKVQKLHNFPFVYYLTWGGLILVLVTVRTYMTYRNSKQKVKIHKILAVTTGKLIFNVPLQEVVAKGSQYYTDAILNRTGEVSSLFDIQNMTGIINLARLIVLTILITYIDKISGVSSFIVVIVSILIYKYGNNYYLKNNAKFIEKKRQYLSDVEDTIFGKEEIENFGTFDYEEKRHNALTEELRKMHTKILARDFIHFFIELDAVRIAYELFIFVWVLNRVYTGLYSLGIGIVLISYSRMLTTPIVYLNSILTNFRNNLTALDIVHNLDKNKTLPNSTPIPVLGKKIEKICFRNVSYRVNEKVILSNLSFELRKGEKLAIVGPSGKGKSTIISLLLKDCVPTSGKILVNDVDIKYIDKDWLYTHIGLLSQNGYLFPTTVEENIRMGNTSVTTAEENEILKEVELSSIELNYKVREGGQNLSGGEKSRLLLARLIAQNKDFVILDEPLEGVDVKTRSKIIENLKTYLASRTAIIITHHTEIANALATRKILI
ncbi:ABC transporter [Anoxybacter fermentans]|uniref:ABC transporter n=1 Tax=Anoxybacter fermentans TaxID=1323375 RepID=A0A3Q9HP45_9FIRM|nr:ABC transporter ATP-binding protein [Anoxybacter fermentans]AZR72388.1 ABC transporter [Anoxybacter fermentans]